MEGILLKAVMVLALMVAVYIGGVFMGNAIIQHKKGEDSTCGFSIMFASVFIAWIFKLVWMMI